ncbi:MAG: cation-transporting P-type ATPase [Methanobrevibacter sp.]|nr:cation-transporting P-type ATPase [Methanobrevibacter sp.]
MEKILETYNSNIEGLSNSEAGKRLNKYGPNKIKEKESEGLLRLFLSQFADVLIILLIFAAILSYAIGNHLDAIVIIVVVIINSIIGFIQEYRAENAMEELKSLVSTEAQVKREGKIRIMSAEELTIGDIVIIEEGNKVPADLILIETYDLQIDESSLTGESMLVRKNSNYSNIDNFDEKIKNVNDHLKEEEIRDKVVSMNSNVLSGWAVGLVIAVGMDTSIGKIASMIQEDEEETPLAKKVDHIGKVIGVLSIIVCIGVFFIDFFQNMNIVEGFMTAVSLAVAAIPEGLPAVLTLTLAIGMQKMAKSNAIVKRLSSVETLGSCTIICTDKTGTLTENKMTVREDFILDERKSVLISGLCNNAKYEDNDNTLLIDAEYDGNNTLQSDEEYNENKSENDNEENNKNNLKLIGNPTDIAVYNFAKSMGFDKLNHNHNFKRIYEIPLDSNRKRMSIIYKKENSDNNKPEYYIFTKGAPELILNLSKQIEKNNTIKEIDANIEEKINQKINEMTNKSLRVIGLSYKKLDENLITELKNSQKSADFDDNDNNQLNLLKEELEKDLTFTGLLGIMDPPRKEAINAVADCQKAGIEVVMITGDHKDTATAIAREIGILNENDQKNINDHILTGEELDKLSDEEYRNIAEEIKVYARVYPEQKRRIIDILQSKGHIVSMTGDGVNDAPALKKAAIGVAMGSGTDVTKESADMIIQDDNFATIVSSIKEGRTIYDNLKRFLKFQLSTNIGAILTITIGSLLPIPTPFTPIQLLWINIIMDGPPAQSLGLEASEDDIMERPPERGDILSRNTMIKITISGIVMTIGTLALFIYELNNPSHYGTSKAITMAFTVFVLYQLFNALNYKSNSKVPNKMLILSLVGTFILQILVIYIPYLQIIFKTCPIGLFDWIIIIIISAMILVTDKIVNKFI